MEKWVTRICRAFMMGLAWAGAWLPIGIVAARLVVVGDLDPEHIGGPLIAGFLYGAAFSAVAGIASGRRRLDDLSLSRAAASGAVSGLLVDVLLFVLEDNVPVAVFCSLTLMSTVSAVASAWLARMAKRGELRDATAGR